MGIFEEDEAVAVEELRQAEKEKKEGDRQARINRGKLDPNNSYVYIFGPVAYDPKSVATKSDPKVMMYAFDLLALGELWEEREGVLVPKEGAGLLRDAHGNIIDGANTDLKVRPYVAVQSLISEEDRVLEQAVNGTLAVEYTDKPREVLVARVFSNSLFDADGKVVLSKKEELHPDLEARAEKIIAFYKELKAKK
ncbi:hypothetical protein KY331_05040 [Candidatus Woesearchaeota archaeon]|nr:hypothetical protein [Candidatus Woesearchaeota archaeon]